MRYMAFIAALMISFGSFAGEPRTPRGVVVAYECEQIDPKVTGFTCTFENGKINIQIHEKTANMPEAKRKRANYEFNKIALRYLEFGGTSFVVRTDFWPESKYKVCGRSKKKAWYKLLCYMSDSGS